MDHGAAELDKQSLRRELRAQRRSRGAERDRAADGQAIATAVGAVLDTLALPASGSGAPPADGAPSAEGAPSADHSADHSAGTEQVRVAIYRALPTEPPTEALAELLHARGVPVIVPELLADRDLDWHELRADGSEGPRLGRTAIAAAPLILTPALAVDHRGTRLGQGGGSYDRALARRGAATTIVALVNDEEYVAWPLPRDPHDVAVDAVITPGSGFSSIPGPQSVA